MEPAVSVIMPVYNTEKYLKAAVASVLEQSFTDFELIICDDGSRDLSGDICDEFARKDPRIKVIHNSASGGVSAARNRALEEASGKYLYYMDSDDEIERDLLKDCVFACEKYECDVVIFGYTRVFFEGGEAVEFLPGIEGLWDFDTLKARFSKYIENVPNTACFKFYRASAAEGVRFDSISTAEDGCYNIDILDKGVSKVYYINKSYYKYYERQHSLLTSYNPERFLNDRYLIGKISALAKKWGVEEETRSAVLSKLTAALWSEYVNVTLPDCPMNLTMTARHMKKVFEDGTCKEALDAMNVSELKWLSMKVCMLLTKKKMYFAAAAFLRIYTRGKTKSGKR